MAEVVDVGVSTKEVNANGRQAGYKPLGSTHERNYQRLNHKPTINGVEVNGDKSLEDYGIDKAIDEKIKEHNNDLDAHQVLMASVSDVERILNEG